MSTRTWRNRFAGVALLTLATATPALGQDLAEVWHLALQRDPAYASIQAGREAEQEVVPQARARLLPYIMANAGAEVDNSRRSRNLSDSRSQQRALWSLTLSQPIVDISAWNALERAQYIAAAADVAQAQGFQNLP